MGSGYAIEDAVRREVSRSYASIKGLESVFDWLDDAIPSRSSVIGDVRSVRNRSLSSFARAHLANVRRKTLLAHAQTVYAASFVDVYMESLLRERVPVSEELLEFSTLDAALLDAAERLDSLRAYMPAIIRAHRRKSRWEDGLYVHQQLGVVQETLGYCRAAAESCYGTLRALPSKQPI